MIDNNLQLISWFSSIFIGFIYSFLILLYKKIIYNKAIIIKILSSIGLILLFSLLLIYFYYKVNGGYVHYSFIVFWICGGYLFYLVKSHVNRHKK